MAPAFHLVCGSTGAGKTTYSLDLAQRLNGIRFSIDEWMVGLFGKDKPEPLSYDWVMERAERCEQQIGRMAIQCAHAGVAPVLDLAFLRASNRANFASLAEQSGFSVALHFLDVPVEERWNCVKARNEGPRRDVFVERLEVDVRFYGEDLGAADISRNARLQWRICSQLSCTSPLPLWEKGRV